MTVALIEQTDKLGFETKTCGRCGGSGHYSFCQMYGTTCFGCGGRGWVYTRRGDAAKQWLHRLCQQRADAFRPGDFFWSESHRRYLRAIDSRPADDGRWWHLVTKSCSYSYSPEMLLRRAATDDEIKQALAYQAGLTKLGKERKHA